MNERWIRWSLISLIVLLFVVAAMLGVEGQPSSRSVVMVAVKGDINPAIEAYLKRGMRETSKMGAEALVVQLDTPGGGLFPTREITKAMLNSDVPIIVYVWPTGAHAASAGTFIVMAGHVAAMAPGTNLGAASPISIGPGMGEGEGKEPSTLMKKVEEDTAAQIRAIAKQRGRNAEWAERAVREAVAITAEQAVELHVIDFVADDLTQVLQKADGRTVQVKGGPRVLHTAGARIESLDMRTGEEILSKLANPNVAYILLLIGIYGIIFELQNPGFGGAGVMGAICLILGLYALSALDVNYAGVALILLSILFFIAEVKAPTHGVLAAGGIASFIMGSLMLIDQPGMGVSLQLIIPAAATTAAFFLFCVGMVVQSQRRRAVTGLAGMLGLQGRAATDLAPEGSVFVGGSLWSAASEEGTIPKGAPVVVVKAEGLKVWVRPV